MQIGKAARSNGSHIKSRLKMEPHGVFKEVTKQCTNKDHYQSIPYDTPPPLSLRRATLYYFYHGQYFVDCNGEQSMGPYP